MVIDPDFLDHWKTQMLVDLLQDPLAPQYVIRIWGHCQMRRQWVFENFSSSALKALCRYNGHANKLESALVASGYLRRDDAGALQVCEWEIYNASLVANWNNGKKGGRPQKPREEKPMGIPSVTHGEPTPSNLSDLSFGSNAFGESAQVSPEEPSRFMEFVYAYPHDKRGGMAPALHFWVTEGLEKIADQVFAALAEAKRKPEWESRWAPRLDKWLATRPWIKATKPAAVTGSDPEADAYFVRRLPTDAVERFVEATKAKYPKYAHWPKSQFVNAPPPEFLEIVRAGMESAHAA